MTRLIETPATDASLERSRRTPWSGRRKALLVLGLIAAAAGVVAWWLVPGAVAVSQTRVLLDARPFTCATSSDATMWVDTDYVDETARVYLPAVQMHPGLGCTMDVVVRNDGDQDVAVDSIAFPLSGPRNSVGIRVDHGYQQGLDPIGGEDAVDAVFDYRNDPRSGGSFKVRAHSVQRFTFHLSWSDGCMDENTVSIFTDSPTAMISSGPWHVAKSWGGAGYAFLGGEDTVAAVCNP